MSAGYMCAVTKSRKKYVKPGGLGRGMTSKSEKPNDADRENLSTPIAPNTYTGTVNS
jgi:hypothetical protein